MPLKITRGIVMGTVPITFSRVIFSASDLPGVGDLEPLAPHFYLCKRSITVRHTESFRHQGHSAADFRHQRHFGVICCHLLSSAAIPQRATARDPGAAGRGERHSSRAWLASMPPPEMWQTAQTVYPGCA